MSKIFLIISLYSSVIGAFASVSAIAVAHISGAISFIAFLFLKDKKLNLKNLTKSQISLLGFSLFIILSLIVNKETAQEFYRYLGHIKYYLHPLLLIPLLKYHRLPMSFWKKLLWFTLFVVSLVTISGLSEHFYGYNFLRPKLNHLGGRARGVSGMIMTYAHNISFILSMLLGLIIYSIKKVKAPLKFALIGSAFIFALGLYFSETRGAWLGFVGSITFLFYEKGNFKKFLTSSFAIVGVFLLLLFQTGKIERFDLQGSKARSNTVRIGLFKSAMMASLENPFFGIGHKQYQKNSVALKKKFGVTEGDKFSGHAHNNYFEAFADLGLVGGSFFILWLVFWIFESGFSDPVSKIVSVFAINFSISGLTQYTAGDGENIVFVGLIFALGYYFKECGSGGTSWIRTGDRPVMSREL